MIITINLKMYMVRESQKERYFMNIKFVGKDHKYFYEKIVNKLDKKLCLNNMLYACKNDSFGSMISPVKWDSIISPKKESIIQYIDQWKSSEKLFKKYGITHKTGILLYGKPGTGKTTIAKAIATQLSYSINIIDLSSTASELSKINLTKNSVVLIEDIDCIVNNRENHFQKENIEKETKLNILLNMIDGVQNTDGIVFVATTNYLEMLDGALKRPGRFNLKIHLDEFGYNEAIQMTKFYNVSPNILKNITFPISPSDLQNRIILYKLSKFGTIK